MIGQILSLTGGLGLFLYGMAAMTAALRQLASQRLRAGLARFTTSPLTGALTGAGATALVHSSSAVIVTAIGFVGAGLMSFPQAVGVILGANVGTTATGWLVAVLGLKLKLGTLALPVLLGAVLAQALAGPAGRRVAQAVAGACLLFLGLDMMQAAASGLGAAILPEALPGTSWGGRLGLVAIGAVVAAVLQSSTAGVAIALVLLDGSSLTLVQAAALVIGMDIGTTSTAVLAAFAGSRDMKRTALAHVAYNLITGVAAFALLAVALPGAEALAGGDAATALVIFHTGFNLFGMVLMLPFAGRFAGWITRLVPETAPSLTVRLEPRFLADASGALDAAQDCLRAIAAELFRSLAAAIDRAHGPAPGSESGGPDAVEPDTVGQALDQLNQFLARITVLEGDALPQRRLAELLHAADHLRRLHHRAGQSERLAWLGRDRRLSRASRALAAALLRAAPAPAAEAARLARWVQLIDLRAVALRQAVLRGETEGQIEPDAVFALTDAMRWLQRTAVHAERIAHHLAAATEQHPARRTR